MADEEKKSWFDDYAEDGEKIQIEEYDITTSPNDFNIATIGLHPVPKTPGLV